MSLPIPNTPADFTPEWLTLALQESGHLSEGKVSAATTTDIGTGRGYVCQTVRINLEYEAAPESAPRSLVAKVPTFVQYDESLQGAYALIQNSELSFYRDLAEDCPVRIPKPYWIGLAPMENRFCLLMEDLPGFRTMAQTEVMDEETAGLAVDWAARMHAHWWHDPKLTTFEWLLPPAAAGFQIQAVYGPAWPMVVERFSETLDPAFLKAGSWLAENVAAAVERWFEKNWTIAHGDYRVENFLFGEPGTDDALVVLDWQLVSRGGPTYDLSYLLGQGLSSEDRQRLERDLIRRYHEGLRAGGVSDYSLDTCWDDYRRGLLIASFVPVNGVLAFETTTPPEDPEQRAQYDLVMAAAEPLMHLMLTRSAAAIVETEAYQFAR